MEALQQSGIVPLQQTQTAEVAQQSQSKASRAIEVGISLALSLTFCSGTAYYIVGAPTDAQSAVIHAMAFLNSLLMTKTISKKDASKG